MVQNEFLALLKDYCTCFILLIFLIDIEDLKDVVEYVFELNMTQFLQLGLQLGLLQPTLDRPTDGIKPEDYGTKVMTEWLNQVDKAQPMWNNLAKAFGQENGQGSCTGSPDQRRFEKQNIKVDVLEYVRS